MDLKQRTAIRVTVLYEDQRGRTNRFGFHDLICACLYDRLNGEFHKLKRALDARPMKGAPKLLQTCREDIEDIARDGRAVIAVFDDDRVRELLRVPLSSPDDVVINAIRGDNASLIVVLLKRNLETVLRAAAQCDATLPAEQVSRALQKDLLARDDVLFALAREHKTAVRACLLREVPSLAEIVTAISAKLL